MRNVQTVILAGALLALAGVGIIVLQNKENVSKKNNATQAQRKSLTATANTLTAGNLNPIEERMRWRKRIGEVGAESAYEELKNEYAPRHFGVQHSVMHIFGELLYETKSIKGLTICDATFAFGCYHSFFGKAFSEQGIHVVKKLDGACLEKYGPLGTGCLHGLGHGLLELIGHERLVEALEACKMTTQLKELFGCTSGVFMEYNVPIIISTQRIFTDVRRLNPENPYEPCNTIVPERFRNSCYYEMGQWWDKVFHGDYKTIGALCVNVPHKYQDSCYLGIGNVTAPSSEYDVTETINKCKKMPTAEGELVCRAGASWSFFSVPERRIHAPEICEDLETKEKQRCALKADLIGERK